MSEVFASSSALILLVIALRLFFQEKIGHRLQYALWGIVLIRLLLSFSLFSSPFSVMSVLPEAPLGEKQVYVLPISRVPADEISGDITADPNSFGYRVLSDDGTTVTCYADKVSIKKIGGSIWLVGSILVGLWFVGVNWRFYKQLVRTRQPYQKLACRLPVYVADQIASPCLFGLVHPSIYLTPKAVASEDTSRYVLAHELCHYRHADHIWATLRILCLAIWWWNPLVWLAAILSQEDSELACDQAVIKHLGQENRFAYGRALVDMIAIKKAPVSVTCIATTMVSGKHGLKRRLHMITQNTRIVIPAIIVVLVIAAIGIGCTFSGAKDDQETDFPTVDMTFTTDNTDFEQIGRDAATFYYTQFMAEDIPQYWHLTNYETLSFELRAIKADDESEFVVWVESYLETDGAGFLIGEGEPNDPDDLSKGGVCPEIGQEFRIKALGDGKYEIVSIGTGGGTQGLESVETVQIKDETDFPTVDMTFTTANTDLEQIGSDAASFYYSQFMADDIPQYWHITNYKALYSELRAGDANEFVVWIESQIETDGAGFVIGEGEPNDPDDLSKGGVCPVVGREFRIKALGDGQYEIVSIGTGGGTQGLDPIPTVAVEYEYELVQLCKGRPVTETLFVTGDDTEIVQGALFSYMIKSAAWPGVDIDTLDECYRIRTNYWDDTATDYYAYLIDDLAVMQRGTDGYYSRIDDDLYQELVELAQGSASAE